MNHVKSLKSSIGSRLIAFILVRKNVKNFGDYCHDDVETEELDEHIERERKKKLEIKRNTKRGYGLDIEKKRREES